MCSSKLYALRGIGMLCYDRKPLRLEKHTQIRRRQNRLIKKNGSARDLPLAIDFSQYVVPRAYEQVLTVLELRPVNQKVRPDPHLGFRVTRLNLHIGYKVAGTRRWYFRPSQPRRKSLDA